MLENVDEFSYGQRLSGHRGGEKGLRRRGNRLDIRSNGHRKIKHVHPFREKRCLE